MKDDVGKSMKKANGGFVINRENIDEYEAVGNSLKEKHSDRGGMSWRG